MLTKIVVTILAVPVAIAILSRVGTSTATSTTPPRLAPPRVFIDRER